MGRIAIRKLGLVTGVSSGALVCGLVFSVPAFAQANTGPIEQTTTGQAVVSGQATPVENATDPVHGETPATVPAGEAPANPEAPADNSSDIVVTGFRGSLQNALNQKRRSNQIVDVITAEDIADFPDANLAESIQRLPGVSIDRDNGEGRSITVRGLGGDFQMVRLNGADAQSIAGGNQSDAGANRSRGFDFNTFASELFGGIKVTKSTSAMNDEGSLGAIIDLTTGRPLSFSKDRIALGAEAEYRENGGTWNPRLTALVSKRFGGNFGLLGSVAWQKQEQQIDAYQRSIGQFEYAYRNSQIAGVSPATFGFSRPSNQGTGPTFGSDPAAYALITPTTVIPALPSITRRNLGYRRLGATLTAQWRPSSRTEVILDGVFSRYGQDSENYGITTIGLNRNLTNARFNQGTLRAPGTTNGNADRLALYPDCPARPSVDCGGTEGGTLIPGTINSRNPNNLDPYDYYNFAGSPGFVPSTNATGGYVPLIGRPSTDIRAANVNAAGQADYLVLDDVDWRSSADAQFGKSVFKQGTLNLTHEFSDRLRLDGTLGWSRSEFRGTGLLVEFNALDRDNYVFDSRGGDIMPVLSPGFDVADPNQWNLVKGLSTIRYFNNEVNNQFKVGRLNFAWDLSDALTLRVGGTRKRYEFDSNQARREQDIEAINPTILEARREYPNLTIADLGQVVGFGQGLDVSTGTPTSFFAPDLDAFSEYFQVDCNCVNKWGDYRGVLDGRERNSVMEKDLSGFAQLDFNFGLFGNPLRGDIGVRVARTRVVGKGSVGGSRNSLGLPVEANHSYTDWLPSTNVVYEPVKDLLVRFAASKTMARPMLGNLTPGTTSFPTGLNATNAPSLTVGNPYLSPFRSRNLDLSFERYFGRNGILALTLFHKKLKSFPQQLAGEMPLSAVFEAEIYEQILANIASPTLRAYTEEGGVFAVRQFQDAPGGIIKGLEVNAQTNLSFLPGPFDNLGVTANYTYINSKLTYLTGSALSTRRDGTSPPPENNFATAPFLNTSPHAFNATLYYEDSRFSARVSGAYRKRYVNRFPLSTGTCAVGITTNNGGPCNSPVVADFGFTENTLNVDAALAYNLNSYLKLTLEGRNLINEPQYRTMYQDSPVTQTYASTGRIFVAGARLIF